MGQGILYENYPTRKRMTVIIPVIAGSLTMIGAGLIAYADGLAFPQAWSAAWGWGFVAGANSLWLVSHGIQQERAAYWQFRAKQVELDIAKHPDRDEEETVELDPADNYTPLGVRLENGVAILRKGRAKKELQPVFTAEVTQYIGSLVIKEPDAGETYTVVDVNYGLWLLAQYDGAEKKTAEREWVGSGKPLSPKEYDLIRDGMIADHLAYWKNSRSTKPGWEITNRARAIMRTLKSTPPPTQKREVKIDANSADSRTQARAHERG